MRFEHLTTEEGLPTNEINVIFQDHLGFLWFGTNYGLVRYDGYSQKLYLSDSDNPNSIGGNCIVSVDEERNGDLWIGTEDGGVSKFERSFDHFIRFQHDPNDSMSLSTNKIYMCHLDRMGFLWVFHERFYVDKICTGTSQVTRYRYNPNDSTSISSDAISCWYSIIMRKTAFLEDHNGYIWIGTRDAGLNRYNPENGKFTRYQNDPKKIGSLSHNHVTCIFEDSQNRLWVGTWGGGINRFDWKSGTFMRIHPRIGENRSLCSDLCMYIYEDRSKDIWFSSEFSIDCLNHENKWIRYNDERIFPKSDAWSWTFIPFYQDDKDILWLFAPSGKLLLLDPHTSTLNFIHHDSHRPYGIPSIANITAILKDHSDNLWFGTNIRGIYKLDLNAQHFYPINYDPGESNTLSSNFVTCIFKSKYLHDDIWIGTDHGLDIFNLKTMKVKHDLIIQRFFNEKVIMSLFEDEDGILWIGTRLDGLYQYDLKNEKCIHYSYQSADGMTNNLFTVTSLFMDKANHLWISNSATPYGLSRLTDNHIFKYYPYKIQYTSSNLLNSTYCFYPEDESHFLAGTKDGIYLYDMKLDIFVDHFMEGYEILNIFKDSKKNLWIGTIFNGLGLFDPKTRSVIFYGTRQGLSQNKVYSILEDDEGYLWLSTECGLSKFDPVNKTFTNFYREHGLSSPKFHSAALKLGNGEIWAATIDGGIVTFNPKDIKLNTIPPKVVFTDIKIFNVPVTIGKDSPLKKDITVADDIHLSHRQNDISIEVTALHFSHPLKNQYIYWLENHDKDWLDTGTNRMATYTNLDPGRYIFHAKATNSDGVWNETGVSMQIVIDPPWWKTWWANLLYTLSFGMIIYGTYRFQLNRARMKQELMLEREHTEKLEEIDQMKSRFFSNISHEFRTPLTLILGPLENLYHRTSNRKIKTVYTIILRNTHHLLRLINQLLDFSKIEAACMTLSITTQDVVALVKGIAGSFDSAAEQKGISLTCTTPKGPKLVSVDRDKFETILTNLLSNAIKFTPRGGKIEILFNVIQDNKVESGEFSQKFLEILVSNTGTGIPEEHIDHIFDRFYQADTSQTREHEGTGLGLALTKELVDLCKGKIVVESKTGEGATFKVCLPTGEPDVSGIYSEGASESAETSRFSEERLSRNGSRPEESKRKTDKSILLVVEDNQDVQFYIWDLLNSDFRIEQANNGLQGYQRASDIIPDLIIADVMMPVMDGFELCKKLKTDERTSHIPVIMLTARAADTSRLEGLETGADDYLVKPFNPKELRIRIRNLIDQRIKLRERYSRQISLQPHDIEISSTDERFLQKAIQIVEMHMTDIDFHVGQFCWEIGMSRVQLHRKLRALVDQSATEFIKNIRLKRAADLLDKKAGNITEIAFQVGFDNPAYFTACFKKQFGVSPKKYTP